jgi:hypothetical protein
MIQRCDEGGNLPEPHRVNGNHGLVYSMVRIQSAELVEFKNPKIFHTNPLSRQAHETCNLPRSKRQPLQPLGHFEREPVGSDDKEASRFGQVRPTAPAIRHWPKGILS